ncbi:MAG: GNAT family N-acetyltransferase [Lachnospiraceae bacterium]|nr:GNAT family N-acetyltransferase [Lachnospiraceae bacterium]
MIFRKENGTKNELRVFNDEGASCTLYISEDTARILSIFVPEEDRKTGVGSDLLKACEIEAKALNKSGIVCDYSSELSDFSSFLSSNDYKLSGGELMISFDTGMLLESSAMQKILNSPNNSIETERLSNMMRFQIDEVTGYLNRQHIFVDKGRLEGYDQTLSVAAYDEDFNIRALLLASGEDEGIYIDLLSGYSKTDTRYILAVCREFIEAVAESGGKDKFPNIRTLTINESVVPLLRKICDKEGDLKEEASVTHAYKILEENGVSTIEETTGGVSFWREEIRDITFQERINEKHCLLDR